MPLDSYLVIWDVEIFGSVSSLETAKSYFTYSPLISRHQVTLHKERNIFLLSKYSEPDPHRCLLNPNLSRQKNPVHYPNESECSN